MPSFGSNGGHQWVPTLQGKNRPVHAGAGRGSGHLEAGDRMSLIPLHVGRFGE